MITEAELRRKSSQKKIRLDLIEKDYILGWIIYGISKTSIRDKIVFKGGTALSKVYFPLNWRISEDLDFTIIGARASATSFTEKQMRRYQLRKQQLEQGHASARRRAHSW